MSNPVADENFPPTIYSFEVEFLVAQELSGFNYDSTFEHFHGPRELPWACPADEQDPYETILEEVRDVFRRHRMPVASHKDSSADQPHAESGSVQNSQHIPPADALDKFWHVEPSVTTYAKRDSPQMYDWFGVRIRSPTHRGKPFTVSAMDSPTIPVLNLLKKGLHMHINSTCRFNVQVRPLNETISPNLAKKMATLVWLLEKELLERLSPNSYGRLFPHVRTLEAHSRVASLIWNGSGERSPPQDPLNSAITDLHLPDLHDKELLARLQFVWQVQSLEGLAAALRATTGQDTSFAIRPTGGPFGTPVFDFRYALWHPFARVDASKHWIQLCTRLVETCMWNHLDFKKGVSVLDDTIHQLSEANASPTVRWKTLLAELGLKEWEDSWGVIISQYKDGQRLSTRFLDQRAEDLAQGNSRR